MDSSDNQPSEVDDIVTPSIDELHTPICSDDVKPYLRRCFQSFEAGVKFYKEYGATCGFDVRRGTTSYFSDKSVSRVLVYCNRQGQKNYAPDGNDSNSGKKKRRRVSSRSGCMARIAIKFDPVQCCVVELFIEEHNHKLVVDDFKKYLKVNRKMTDMQKNFMLGCARANIGASKARKTFKAVTGDPSWLGSTTTDWKNYARDLRAYIDGCDAQIMLQKMNLKKDTSDAFYYAYEVGKDDHLRSVFWADPIARRNYYSFGDVVSFDGTYSTNRYNMIFAPFTGKDNHGKIVTFGAALLPGEDNTLYGWVFEKFRECMVHPPRLIITDQDPAIKIAVERVFPESVHRLCMWHIMRKLPEKTPQCLKQSGEFRKQFNDIVWTDMLQISDFEKKWSEIMAECGLISHKWFISMYDIRHYWIPTYFRDIPMSGVCRTTSISESVNNFFGHYLNSKSNLVEFLMHFESAMDAQRYTNDILNSKDSLALSYLKTPLQLEKHAASLYTSEIFKQTQEEIEDSCFRYKLRSMKETDEGMMYEVYDASSETFWVKYIRSADNIVCKCNKFLRDGLLCSHIYLVMNQMNLVTIPDKYIVYRWTKMAYSRPLYGTGDSSLVECVDLDEKKKLLNNIISLFYGCVGMLDGDMEKMQKLMNALIEMKNGFGSGVQSSSSGNKYGLFEMFYDIEKPTEICVLPPHPVKTKGSASDMVSKREAAVERAKKPLRLCRKCNTYGHHDSRNCKNLIK